MSTIIYPQLDGVKINEDRTLPIAIIQAIRKAYDYLAELQAGSPSGIEVIENTHANRILYPATAYALGSLYIETDRSLTYIVKTVASVREWVYYTGIYPRTQAQLAAVATGLGTRDTGLLVDVTDYAHILRWSGSAWTYADPSDPAGRVEGWFVDPSPITGWHLCDGASVNYLKSDGTTASLTLPDLIAAGSNAAYLKFGSPSSTTPNAAIAPTLVMNSYTPAGTVTAPTLTMNSYTPAGTVAAPTLTMDSYTPAGAVAAPTFTGSALATHQHTLPFNASGTAFVFSSNPYGVGSTVTASGLATGAGSGISFAGALDEPVSAGTPAGTNSAPAFTGTPATLTGTNSAPAFSGTPATLTGTNSIPVFTGTPAVLTGTISATGEPRNVIMRPYFRL